MKFTLVVVIVLVALVSGSNCQFGIPGFAGFGAPGFLGPPVASPGWLIGQEASKNAVNLAVSSAIAKSDSTTLSPELQEELQAALQNAEVGLAACDDLLLTSTVWRYKICKFQEVNKLKLKIQELKLKAAAAAATTTTAATSESFQSESVTQSIVESA